MVVPFEPRGGQAAARTDPRLIIHRYFSGLYPADEDEGALPPQPAVAAQVPVNIFSSDKGIRCALLDLEFDFLQDIPAGVPDFYFPVSF
jgi:hypothetical protein